MTAHVVFRCRATEPEAPFIGQPRGLGHRSVSLRHTGIVLRGSPSPAQALNRVELSCVVELGIFGSSGATGTVCNPSGRGFTLILEVWFPARIVGTVGRIPHPVDQFGLKPVDDDAPEARHFQNRATGRNVLNGAASPLRACRHHDGGRGEGDIAHGFGNSDFKQRGDMAVSFQGWRNYIPQALPVRHQTGRCGPMPSGLSGAGRVDLAFDEFVPAAWATQKMSIRIARCLRQRAALISPEGIDVSFRHEACATPRYSEVQNGLRNLARVCGQEQRVIGPGGGIMTILVGRGNVVIHHPEDNRFPFGVARQLPPRRDPARLVSVWHPASLFNSYLSRGSRLPLGR